ncbi:MAG: hypothetical protein RJB38_499 [Pseudomonadota bacterium]|jgi:hypothetical protein
MEQQEILEQLKQLALKRSQPFCYSCYDVPSHLIRPPFRGSNPT